MGIPANKKDSPSENESDNKTEETNENKTRETEEGELKESEAAEEDVPDDFFDDFSNQDFMDGLDIVDAWDDSEKKAKNAKEKEEKRKERKRSSEKFSSPSEKDKRKRSNERKSNDKKRKSVDKEKSKNTKLELRRDPMKTKRDLERDREKYVKKKEQKLISKVVETGLVPPGMEMEVNIFDIQETSKDKKVEKEVKKTSSKSKEKKSRERSRDKRRRSRSFNRSPIYRHRIRSNERRRRERSRDRSRDRIRRTRSPEYNRMSPYRGRRSVSDRERWLQSRRSTSPEKKYKMGEEKLTFLEELKIKLDSIHSNPVFPFPNSTPTNYMPSVVYPNQMTPYFPPNSNSPYDQSFFIGDAQPASLVPPTPVAPVILPHQMNSVNLLSPVTDFMGISKVDNVIGPVPPPNPVQIDHTSVTKLMEQIRATTSVGAKNEIPEKKLSLSDYLTINKKPAAYSTNSEAFKKKINVLSRCQDVLNELSGDKKHGGRLQVRKTDKTRTSQDFASNISPLLRTNPIKFSYNLATEPERTTFQSVLSNILSKYGLLKPEIRPRTPSEMQKFTKQKSFTKTNETTTNIRTLMKMCQTDPVSCEECAERKRTKFKDAAVQCGETERYNVGVQVIEADITNFRIPKNQSLAYLTPAQLLGRSEAASTKVDSFTSFEKPATQQQQQMMYRDYRDPRAYGHGTNYPNSMYHGTAIWDPRFPRF